MNIASRQHRCVHHHLHAFTFCGDLQCIHTILLVLDKSARQEDQKFLAAAAWLQVLLVGQADTALIDLADHHVEVVKHAGSGCSLRSLF